MTRISFYHVEVVKEESHNYNISRDMSSPKNVAIFLTNVLRINKSPVENFGVLALDMTEKEKVEKIQKLCTDDIYVHTCSKPVGNRFKFIQKECKKAKRPCLTKVHRSEKYGLVWTDAYVLCTFRDDTFPTDLLATEKEKLNVDNVLKSVGNDKANASVEYKDVKARLACLSTKKEKEADIIAIGDSVFKTCLVDKVFKFYGLDKLDLHTKK